MNNKNNIKKSSLSNTSLFSIATICIELYSFFSYKLIIISIIPSILLSLFSTVVIILSIFMISSKVISSTKLAFLAMLILIESIMIFINIVFNYNIQIIYAFGVIGTSLHIYTIRKIVNSLN